VGGCCGVRYCLILCSICWVDVGSLRLWVVVVQLVGSLGLFLVWIVIVVFVRWMLM